MLLTGNAPLSTTDVIKKSVLEGFNLASQNLTAANILVTLGMAFAIGIFIFFVYRQTFKGVLYSHSFNLSLIMLAMVTSLIIMIISNSLALSLGMVGALSIVRFRTAVKDPSDTVYMFWSISAGITVGAGYYLLAIIACLVIGACIFLLTFFSGKGSNTFLLVVHCSSEGEKAMLPVLRKIQRRKMKSKTVTRNGVEVTYEVRLSDERSGVVDELLAQPGVYDATLVSYKADMA
ncbi:MAG: DUF4956 domain-containing protein [Christensenellales bacterium]